MCNILESKETKSAIFEFVIKAILLLHSQYQLTLTYLMTDPIINQRATKSCNFVYSYEWYYFYEFS